MARSKYDRPAFLDRLSRAYSQRRKSVVLLTGATHDLFFSREASRFLELERTLFQAFRGKFLVQRLDISTGLGVFDPDDLKTLSRLVTESDGLCISDKEKIGSLEASIGDTRHSPLPALVLLRELLESVNRLSSAKPASKAKPVCTIIKFAGSLFPQGDFNQLGELDRQRLVTFLNLIESPWFRSSNHLVILVADTKSEVNSRIIGLPSVESIEIELPDNIERRKFVEGFLGENDRQVSFEGGRDRFIDDTAGLTLTAIEDLLQVACGSRARITRKDVLDEINAVLKADLGDIIKMSRPEHTTGDVIGYSETGEILKGIFSRCEDPETAVPAILISGPNGAGKTFQLEAYASESGRVVIELAGLRGQWFGQTDQFFEKLLLRIKTYGKILILVDEAHTAFGSVHSSNTHETEKRLAGNIIKMMGDRKLFGKVLWGLMTSRPDELDPDVKSRAPIQIPIFDLEGEDRKTFVQALFKRKGIAIPETEFEEVMEITASYSNRDYDFLVKEVKGSGSTSVVETLKVWQASSSIRQQRRLQSMIAALHCSYPMLLPADLKELAEGNKLESEIHALRLMLHG